MKLHELTALQLGAAIKKGEISIPEVTRAALERAKESGNNAFITLTEEQAMTRAAGLQDCLGKGDACFGEPEGPLYGVPMALKATAIRLSIMLPAPKSLA